MSNPAGVTYKGKDIRPQLERMKEMFKRLKEQKESAKSLSDNRLQESDNKRLQGIDN
jgi:hypothetical protein